MWTKVDQSKNDQKKGKAQTTPCFFYLLNIWMFALCTFLVSWSSFHCQHLHCSHLVLHLCNPLFHPACVFTHHLRFACSLGLFLLLLYKSYVCLHLCVLKGFMVTVTPPNHRTNMLLAPVAVMKRKRFVRRRSTL